MILFSVVLLLYLLQIAATMTSENLMQLDDPRITQLLFTQFESSKHYNVTQFSSTWVQKNTQALPEIRHNKTFASAFIGANAKRIESFRCSATIQKTRVNFARGAHDK